MNDTRNKPTPTSASPVQGRYTYETIKCGYVINQHGEEEPLDNYPELRDALNKILLKMMKAVKNELNTRR